MKLHESITEERIEQGARESMFGEDMCGVCIACGEEAYGVEPDAEEYRCEACGQMKVYGWEQVLLHTVA